MKTVAIDSLREQLTGYRQLVRLCELQREYVQRNQTDELLGVLEQRGAILQSLAVLEQNVAPLKRNWAEASASMTQADRESVQSMLAETRALLEQITQADQDDVLLLQQRKLNVGRQIAQASSARAVNSRYAASAYGSSSGSRLNVQK